MISDPRELPDHVQRMIHRSEEVEFTPPSFERWLGRLQMVRTLAAMAGFLLVWLASYGGGEGWEGASVRGIVAALAFYFFAWAIALFVFGELYDIEVRRARTELEERERERARKIERYYRQRLLEEGLLDEDGQVSAAGDGALVAAVDDMGGRVHTMPPAQHALSDQTERRAA